MGSRYYEVDLLRFVAALLVVFFHYCFRGYAAGNYSTVAFPEFADVAKYGYLGVDLFFMISGFVIIASARGRSVRTFLVARARRLYPAFWTCCTLTAAVIALWGGDRFSVSWGQYLGNLPLFGWGFGVRAVDGVYWSLNVELHFYLLVALIIVTNSLGRLRAIMAVWLLLSVMNVFYGLPQADRLELQWAPYFVAGTFFYLISDGDRRRLNFVVLGAALAAALFTSSPRLDEVRQLYHVDYSAVTMGGIETAFFVSFLLVTLGYTRILRRPFMMALGALTYPLYLVHQDIGYIVLNSAYPRYDRFLVLTALLGLVLLMAFAVHRFVEVPGSRMLAAALDSALDKFAIPVRRSTIAEANAGRIDQRSAPITAGVDDAEPPQRA